MKFKRSDFTLVPNKSALRGLKPTVQVVYMWLCNHSDDNMQSFPSKATLADECGTSVKSVERAINELIKQKLVKAEPRQRSIGGKASNMYTVQLSEKITNRCVTESQPIRQPDASRCVTESHITIPSTNSTQLTKSTNVDLAEAHGKTEINELFDYWQQATGIQITSRVLYNRRACHNLLRRYGEQGVRKLIDGVALAHGDRYAPRIASFESLQQKLPELTLWGKQRAKSSTMEVIS